MPRRATRRPTPGTRSATPAPGRAAEPAPRWDVSFAVVLLCFLLSGFAALLYQTAWTRQFAFVFGTSELAVATVLAAYMGGLAGGAAAAARLAARTARPVLVYGILELGIALAALAVPFGIRLATSVAVAAFGGREQPPSAEGPGLALFYLLCAFAILLVPTGLMGATLPVLARFAVRRPRDVAPRVGGLYAINTFGAVLGTLAAGFVLLPRIGLRQTILAGVAVNAVVFLMAAALGRAGTVPPAAGAAGAPRAGGAGGGAAPAGAVRGRGAAPFAGHAAAERVALLDRRGVFLPLVLIAGATSFTYEVLWTRLLGHILGGSSYAFATMLATFLAGIALGSAVAARLGTTEARAARGFAAAEVGVGLLSLAAFLAMDRLPALAVWLGAGLVPGHPGNAALAGLVMLPSALCIGATFPLVVRVVARGDADAPAATGRAYAWNTAGAIAGAVGAGFFLIPLLGYAGILAAAVAVNLLVALAAALAAEPRSRALAAAALGGLALLVLVRPATPWRLVGTSPLSPGRDVGAPVHFAVGRSSAVAVTAEHGAWRVRTNGLPEGTMILPGHNSPSVLERWLGALPALARPEARAMLVIGLGGGSVLEAIPRTVELVDVIELEPRVIEANRLFGDRRAVNPLADPRVRLHANDARGALVLTARRYDAVVSQPSHPWTAGASHLYTREFFALVRDRLEPGGVFVQWIELHFIDEPLLRTLLATLLDVFPHLRVYRPVFRSGVLFLASDAPLPVEATAERAIAASPEELAWANVQAPEDVAAALALDEEGARRLAAGAPISTDDRNLLETRSPRLTEPLRLEGGDRVLRRLDPLPRLSAGLDRLYLVRRLLADGDWARAVELAQGLADPTERLVGQALVALANRATDHAKDLFRQALARDPRQAEAGAALLRLERDALLDGDPELAALAARLGAPAAAVVEGWRRERAGDAAALAAGDAGLAALAPREPFYPDALRLRARWRILSGDRRRAAEAVALADRALAISIDPGDALLRAEASLAAGNPSAALQALARALDGARGPERAAVARRARLLLARVPAEAGLAGARGRVEARLGGS